ncbi:MAG: FAD/NAD(P)-binding protein [Pseudoxanthomonas sp.]
MTNGSDDAVFDIAIVGGGAGGVLAAIHALRLATAPKRIALIEPAANLAEGVAYATRHREHVLNVPVRRMSAFADAPDDFLDYVGIGSDRTASGQRYAERRRYAEYLRVRLDEARQASPATLRVVRDRVVELDFEPGNGPARLALANGAPLHAHGVVVAIGNRARPLPARGANSLPAAKLLAAWDYDAVKRIDRDADVCIVGSGLSMADALLSLSGNGHRGALHVLSRHAILPLPHTASHRVAEFDVPPLLAQTLRQRVRALRGHMRAAAAAGLPWQAVMERLRPHGPALWQSLSAADQRRFLRHAARYWDVHRHRVAPQVHACIEALRADGRLRVHRGRLRHAIAQGNCVRLGWQRHDGRLREFDVDAVVNATGVELRAQAMRNPLLDGLLGRGLARPGPHGIGIDTAPDGRVLDAGGRAQPRLFALGSLRIGTLWESIAVPELRVQAEAIAGELLL